MRQFAQGAPGPSATRAARARPSRRHEEHIERCTTSTKGEMTSDVAMQSDVLVWLRGVRYGVP